MNTESKVFAKVIPVEIFKIGVLLLVGEDMKELRKAFSYCVKPCYTSKKEINDRFDSILEDIGKAKEFTGITIIQDISPDPIIYIPKFKESILVHELVHAVESILSSHDISENGPGEVRAYLTEYLYSKFTNQE